MRTGSGRTVVVVVVPLEASGVSGWTDVFVPGSVDGESRVGGAAAIETVAGVVVLVVGEAAEVLHAASPAKSTSPVLTPVPVRM